VLTASIIKAQCAKIWIVVLGLLIALVMETVNTSKTSMSFHHGTQRNTAEGHLHTQIKFKPKLIFYLYAL
jgi:hypothetical protein